MGGKRSSSSAPITGLSGQKIRVRRPGGSGSGGLGVLREAFVSG